MSNILQWNQKEAIKSKASKQSCAETLTLDWLITTRKPCCCVCCVMLCRTTSSLRLLFRISSTDHTDHAAVTKGCELAGLAWTFRTEDFVHKKHETLTRHVSRFITFFLSYTFPRPLRLNPGLFFNLNDQFSTWRKDDSIRSILICDQPLFTINLLHGYWDVTFDHSQTTKSRATTHLCRGVVQLGQFLHIGSQCFWLERRASWSSESWKLH